MSENPRPELDAWTDEVIDALELEGVALDTDAVLALAGTAAHAVLRPAAPLTTYLLGVVVGRALAAGGDPHEAAARATAVIEARAAAR